MYPTLQLASRSGVVVVADGSLLDVGEGVAPVLQAVGEEAAEGPEATRGVAELPLGHAVGEVVPPVEEAILVAETATETLVVGVSKPALVHQPALELPVVVAAAEVRDRLGLVGPEGSDCRHHSNGNDE